MKNTLNLLQKELLHDIDTMYMIPLNDKMIIVFEQNFCDNEKQYTKVINFLHVYNMINPLNSSAYMIAKFTAHKSSKKFTFHFIKAFVNKQVLQYIIIEIVE
jgi:hypothetical protein